MSIVQRINNMTKPTSKLRFTNIAPILANGLSTATSDRKIKNDKNSKNKSVSKKTLMEFIRMYKIGNIPIMDFLITYILLYVSNKLYLNLDNKYVIIATIPITLLMDMILDDEITPSILIISIIIITCTYMLVNINKMKTSTDYI